MSRLVSLSRPSRAAIRSASSVLWRPCSKGKPIARSVARLSDPITSAVRITSSVSPVDVPTP